MKKYGLGNPDYLVPPAKNLRIGVDRDAAGKVIGPGAHTDEGFLVAVRLMKSGPTGEPAPAVLVQAVGLTKRFGEIDVLKDVDLSVAGRREGRDHRTERFRQDHAAALRRPSGAADLRACR